MANIKKVQLYNLIGEARTARLAELDKLYTARKKKAFQNIIDNNKLEESFKKIHANLLENKKLATCIVDVLPVGYCDVKDAAYDRVIQDYEEWKTNQYSRYIGQSNETLNAIEYDATSERDLIWDEFEKVMALVKQSSSAKKAMVLMEEIGFDVSSLEAEVKYELTTTDIKKDLLGLKSK
ncbi:hypothetical protein HB904_09420 [Listeria booriae]|uniref:Uncharacterized protein n=1 Tax=Listeria booriae TaxID=1552123 RepID=A0A842AKA5_9LIST|nr:hypothetical protein [Listeria booriae]MBC1616408.1 hypothetical protein [Listeria booriae]